MTTVNVSRSLLTALRAQLRVLADKDPAVFGTGTSDDCPPWPIIEEMIHDLTKALASAEQPSEGDVGRDVLSEIADELNQDEATNHAPVEFDWHTIRHPEQYARGIVEEAKAAILARLKAHTPPQEPVAWMIEDFRSPARFSTDPRTPVMAASRPDHLCTPLYLAPPANDEATKCVCGQPAEFCGHCVTAVVRPRANDEAGRLCGCVGLEGCTDKCDRETSPYRQAIEEARILAPSTREQVLDWIIKRAAFLTTHKQEEK